MPKLNNDLLHIDINPIGAELCDISSIRHGTQFMWNGNPDIWANFAPNLFPIVGMLKDETYYFEGKPYQLPKHGFIRNNTKFQVIKESNTSVTLRLSFDEDSLKSYPFKFEYLVIFELDDTKLHITYKVINKDSKTIYFSIGGHPAFKCPVYPNENYKDYRLVFETEEISHTHLLNLKSGLVTSNTAPIFDSPTHIQLRPDLFDKDALIFKDLKSQKVTLNSHQHGDILTLHFSDFPYLGLWAKPNSDYVCIEPWLGIADHEDTDQQLTTKEGIIALASGKEFSATYTIEIHRLHLV